uniref:Uncharacterized protein n=1 Tax=Bursaphelenchus xylophilus TaxID=6326 RepID=A0A1I7SPL6_BURXY
MQNGVFSTGSGSLTVCCIHNFNYSLTKLPKKVVPNLLRKNLGTSRRPTVDLAVHALDQVLQARGPREVKAN